MQIRVDGRHMGGGVRYNMREEYHQFWSKSHAKHEAEGPTRFSYLEVNFSMQKILKNKDTLHGSMPMVIFKSIPQSCEGWL